MRHLNSVRARTLILTGPFLFALGCADTVIKLGDPETPVDPADVCAFNDMGWTLEVVAPATRSSSALDSSASVTRRRIRW